MNDNRYQLDLRAAIDRDLKNGYEIVCRCPLMWKRGRSTRYEEKGIIKEIHE